MEQWISAKVTLTFFGNWLHGSSEVDPQDKKLVEKFWDYGMQKFFCITGDLSEVFLNWLPYEYLRVTVIIAPNKRQCSK